MQADFWLASCSLIWGATFVLLKSARADASVFVFLALRFALAAVALAAIYYDTVRRMDRAIFWAGTAIGWFMFAGYALQTIGLKYTTPLKAAFITGTSVVMVPVLQAILARWSTGVWVCARAIGALVGLFFWRFQKRGSVI